MTAAKRILVVLPPLEEYSPATGGAVSTVAEALARRWIERGHEVVVLSQTTDVPYTTGEVRFLRYRIPETRRIRRFVLGVVRRTRRYDWPLYTRYVRDVRRQVRQVGPDWVVLHNDVVLPALGLHSRHVKIALTLHNSVSSPPLRRARRSANRVRLITAVSTFIAEETATRLNLPSSRIQVVHNGVDARFYSGTRRALAPGEPLRVVVLGRLLFDKGAHVLLGAVARLRDEGIRLVPTVIGSPGFQRSAGDAADPYVARIREELARLDGIHHEHLGRREVAELLATQDVVVVPSLFEDPFPLVVYEGMAAGCAVAVSDRGGLPEAAGPVGAVTPPGDVGALAGVLRRWHSDRTELIRRQDAGLARAQQNDWRLVADRWLDLFEAAERS